MPKAFVTYKIKNERNGKFYVGSTNDTGHRWSLHRKNIREVSKSGCYLMRLDIEKNGWTLDDFSFGVIETFQTREDMLSGEQVLLNTDWGTAKNYNGAHEVFRDTVRHSWFAWNLRTLEHRRYLSLEALSVDFRLGPKAIATLVADNGVAPGDWVFEPFSRKRTVREIREWMQRLHIESPANYKRKDAPSWPHGFACSIADLVHGHCKVQGTAPNGHQTREFYGS